MMSCLQEEYLQAYVAGDLTKDACKEVSAHLVECTRCAAYGREMEQALAAISSAFDDELPVAVPTIRLRARIESALAAKAAPHLTLAQLFRRFGLIATAALVILSVIIWFAFGRRLPATPKPDQPTQAESPAPVPQTSIPPRLEPDDVVAQQPTSSRPRRHVRHQSSLNNEDEVEVVTRFFPLREGEDLTAIENARLVRVELPGTALREVGLPVTAEAANVPVIADVLLGQDGLARAIRFVR